MKFFNQECPRCHRGTPRLLLQLPFISKQKDGYDIRRNVFVRGRFTLMVLIGDVRGIVGVSRSKWLPFVIWAWEAPEDGVEISSAEAVY